MNRIFGQKKVQAPAPSLGDASGKIDGRLKGLDDKIKALDDELRKFQVLIKRSSGATQANHKRRAIDVLKRKKMYEQQRDQLAAQSFNVDQTNFALDSVKDTITTVDAMKGAHKALKVEAKKVKIDDIEDLTDDLADMMEDMNEINDALGRNYGVSDEIDEADLDAELAGLEDELEGLGEMEADATASSVEATPAYLLPSEPVNAPEAKIGAQTTTDEFGLPVAPVHN
ncbi:hypothetical protein NSK_006344 [Nannochloropsis salina CCMP1776]|uniref:Charged multivesicular body protein 5 n=1 Tax=Nannochloropsis salina CCMP1776 TaxID=1027361 RepID=A0A4D9CUR9_9STRA|nr:hypothetical protein NSK_006344 [Nannochloropsis salina CCMP1776]|eukprot:TFJ82334.1 hypothetical protein NSK_006344 [Nannochloropsis salina CCMP1776]